MHMEGERGLTGGAEAEQKRVRAETALAPQNPPKKRAMEGRMDRVLQIDLSVKLDEEEEGSLPVEDAKDGVESPGSMDLMSDSGVKSEEDNDCKEVPEREKSVSGISTSENLQIEEQAVQIQANRTRININNPSEKSTVEDCSSPPEFFHRQESVIRNQLASLQTEMGRTKEENERLKMVLAQIMNNYQNLQIHLFNVMQQQQQQDGDSGQPAQTHHKPEETSLICLSLGTNPSKDRKEVAEIVGSKGLKESKLGLVRSARDVTSPCGDVDDKSEEHLKARLSLTLDCKVDQETISEEKMSLTNSPLRSDHLAKTDSMDNISTGHRDNPENNISKLKDETTDQQEVPGTDWPMKTSNTPPENSEPAPTARKARVSVRARCEAPTMNDGCQWRKYGQKIAKGNPCPRAYYRCTVAPGCPVRKQVQRCAEDMSILITTYEGTHNHPLPITATAMASTTAAAACMLLSGSSSSLEAINSNSYLAGNGTRMAQYLASNPNIISSSSTASFPTITLDLTKNPSNSQLSLKLGGVGSAGIAGAAHGLAAGTNFPLHFRYPSGQINNMLSHQYNMNSCSNILGSSDQGGWANNNMNNLYYHGQSHGYNSKPSTYTDQQFQQRQPLINGPMSNAAKAVQAALSQYSTQSLIQNIVADSRISPGSAQPSLADTVSAATAAITSDPNFKAALANAITSIIGHHGSQQSQPAGSSTPPTGAVNTPSGDIQNHGCLAPRIKWGTTESSLSLPAYTAADLAGTNACGSSYARAPQYPNSQSNVLFSAASVPFSTKQWAAAASENQNL